MTLLLPRGLAGVAEEEPLGQSTLVFRKMFMKKSGKKKKKKAQSIHLVPNNPHISPSRANKDGGTTRLELSSYTYKNFACRCETHHGHRDMIININTQLQYL